MVPLNGPRRLVLVGDTEQGLVKLGSLQRENGDTFMTKPHRTITKAWILVAPTNRFCLYGWGPYLDLPKRKELRKISTFCYGYGHLSHIPYKGRFTR